MNPGLSLFLLLPSALAMAWLVTKAQWFWVHREDLQFGFGVPILCAFLFWQVWLQRPPLRCRWSLTGGLVALLGAGVLFIAQIYQAAFGMMAASLTGLAIGILLLVSANFEYVFGWRGAGRFAFPFLFFLLALPMPSVIYSPVVYGLQSMVTTLDVGALNLIGIPARKVGSVIQLVNGVVGIDEACSGIRSLQASLMLTLFIGHLKLKYRLLQGILLAAGVGWSVLGNFIRSLFLSCIANSKGTEAIGVYHDAAGWYILIFTFAGVLGSAWALQRLELAWEKFKTQPDPLISACPPERPAPSSAAGS
jgi:exosortase